MDNRANDGALLLLLVLSDVNLFICKCTFDAAVNNETEERRLGRIIRIITRNQNLTAAPSFFPPQPNSALWNGRLNLPKGRDDNEWINVGTDGRGTKCVPVEMQNQIPETKSWLFIVPNLSSLFSPVAPLPLWKIYATLGGGDGGKGEEKSDPKIDLKSPLSHSQVLLSSRDLVVPLLAR